MISARNAGAPAQRSSAGFSANLIDDVLLSRSDLSLAEQHAARENMQLADAVVALGFVSEADSYAALSRAIGVELVDLGAIGQPSELAVRLIPERLARRHRAVPLTVDNRRLTYATSRPFGPDTEVDLGFAAGRRVSMLLATNSAVSTALDRCYPKLRELDILAERLRAERPTVEDADSPPHNPAESVVVDLCNQLVGRAVEAGASDIHIECGVAGTLVRYRICGVLEPVLTLPANVSHPIRNRFKIMARADIAIRHKPQDGAFRLSVNSRPIDVRLSTLPTVDGEKIVMRVIDSQSPLQTLEKLAYDEDTLLRLRRSLMRPDGLVLVTGPTGSGKTTALYAALAHLRTGRTNIVSVEDPVERTIAGVTQIPVNTRAGNSFAAVLRSLMRQDPNVIMVGEIRDAEVAQIVGQAAYTGHLVLSSIHTVDTATAVSRLMNLGLEPFKIAESLSAVLAQRLLRVLCPECRRPLDEVTARQLCDEYDVTILPYTAGPGCAHCKHTGYGGRVPIAELLTPNDDLRAAIARGATAHDIRSAMRAAGIPTMRDHALRLAMEGVTSIEEVNRVLAEDALTTSHSRQQSRVLISDDDPIARMLVKLLLEREGFNVLEAADGAQAVEIATRERPDLIILDLNMPQMDGYEALARLRRDLSFATVPVLVLTSEDGPGIERKVLDMGADDYVLKPFDASVLLSRVNAVFRRLKVMAA